MNLFYPCVVITPVKAVKPPLTALMQFSNLTCSALSSEAPVLLVTHKWKQRNTLVSGDQGFDEGVFLSKSILSSVLRGSWQAKATLK